MLLLCIGLGVISIIIFITFLLLLKKYKEVSYQFYSNNGTYLYNKGKITLIDTQMKCYEAGQNPYTTLRNISNILGDIKTD